MDLSALASLGSQSMLQDKQILADSGHQAADYYNQKHLAQQQVTHQRELMDYSNKLQLLAARDMPTAIAQGVRDAGLNPQALSPSQMSVGSMPSGSAAAGHSSPVSSPLGMASLADNMLKMAEVRSLEAQTNHQEIINRREETADTDYSEAIADNLSSTIDIYKSYGLDTSKLEDDLKRLQENPTNLGNYVANMRAIESSTSSVSGFADKIANLLKMAIDDRKLRDSEIVDDVAKLDSRQSQLYLHDMALKMAQSYYFTQSGDEAKEAIKNLAKEREKIDGEISLMQKHGELTEAQADKIRNSDVNTLIANGDYSAALRAEGVELVGQAAHGAGFGFGMAAGSRVGGLPFAGTGLGRLSEGAAKAATKTASKKAVTLSKEEFKNLSSKVFGKYGAAKGAQIHNQYYNRPASEKALNFAQWLKKKGLLKRGK